MSRRTTPAIGGRNPRRFARRSGGRTSGVTLVELLVALAVAALILTAAGGLLSTARAGERTLSDTVEPRRALELAAELLREEIALAGFEPWQPAAAGGDPLPDAGPGLARIVVTGAASATQEIGLAFIDDRLPTGFVVRQLDYSADLDGRGVAQLYRRSGPSSRQPVVEGVSQLEVTGYLDAGGLHPTATTDHLALLTDSLDAGTYFHRLNPSFRGTGAKSPRWVRPGRPDARFPAAVVGATCTDR